MEMKKANMNSKWMKLIEQFEENGLTPWDVQRMVHFYESIMEQDKLLKKLYEAEKNETANS